jgi:hypothetical protein
MKTYLSQIIMNKDIIDDLYRYSETHQHGKWFVPAVVALLQIDGPSKYKQYFSDSNTLLQTLNKVLHDRFQGVYNTIEDWAIYTTLTPLQQDSKLSLVVDSVDVKKLTKKLLDHDRIKYKIINNLTYVFKL